VRFQALTAPSMKIRAFWDVAPCSLIRVDRRFRDVYCLYHQGGDGGKQNSETSVYSKQTTQRYIPEDSNLQVLLKITKISYDVLKTVPRVLLLLLLLPTESNRKAILGPREEKSWTILIYGPVRTTSQSL
jgi:hypothetical protein